MMRDNRRPRLPITVKGCRRRIPDSHSRFIGPFIHQVEQRRGRLCWCRNPAAARWREAKLGRDTHHDFGLPVGDGEIGDWIGKPVGDLIIAPYFWICAVASAQSAYEPQ
jgi:hypothetical protein